jgi:hypothetical protein
MTPIPRKATTSAVARKQGRVLLDSNLQLDHPHPSHHRTQKGKGTAPLCGVYQSEPPPGGIPAAAPQVPRETGFREVP